MKTNVHFWEYLAECFLEWEIFQKESCRETQATYFPSITFFQKSCRLWDNVEKYCRTGQTTDDNIIRRMCIVCWINKAKDTQSEYVILISFPRQQWLRERALMLRYTYISCIFVFIWVSVSSRND